MDIYINDYYQRGHIGCHMLNEVGELVKECRIYLGGNWPIDITDNEVERATLDIHSE